MADFRQVRNVFLVVLFFNICYFLKIYRNNKIQTEILNFRHSYYNYYNDDQISIGYLKEEDSLPEEQKLLQLLHDVKRNENNTYWLANATMEYPSIMLNAADFLPPPATNPQSITWYNNPKLYYEPRLTLAIYLDELKHQLKLHNPHNSKAQDHLIKLPFSWSDWVDLTMLNTEIIKPVGLRNNCEWLQKDANKRTRFPDFCKNLVDLSDEEINEIGLSKDQLPGFIVKSSPMNKAPHMEVMMQGKSYLYAQQENPLTLVFLTSNGTYEAQVTEKREKLLQTDLLQRFLKRRKIDIKQIHGVVPVEFNPQSEFQKLLSTIPPRTLDPSDDLHGISKITSNKGDRNILRQLNLDPSTFHYTQQNVEQQIAGYETRLNRIEKAITDELNYDLNVLETNRLTRHELNHYRGLKHANSFSVDVEPTYYKLATLKKTQYNLDSGWHYEWRFFNGAMRYLKDDTWSYEQMEVREQIILDRLLRNWFKFAEAKGIVSWIAHGPLLSWYWDGLMFPFDIDIDLQMPSSELNRLAANYNMTLVIEDLNEGYGKYLIDCSTFIHHRNVAGRDNHIDARFIDVDTGTYIDITGMGLNDEKPPSHYDNYIKEKTAANESVELYMDRRKHWLNYEKINPLRYSMLGGVPVFVPNDIMSMLNQEYPKGTKSYYYDGYYYVPLLRLWLQESKILAAFKPEQYEAVTDEARQENILELIKTLRHEDAFQLLKSNKDMLTEYYLTQKYTGLHQREKQLMMDEAAERSVLDLEHNEQYNRLTSNFYIGPPLRKCLFDFEYYGRFKHMPKQIVPTIVENDQVDKPQVY
ncbi:mannosylphosphorylation of N-linked oligosaccharides effector, putative [Candida dubliniensis CD36]|uniref:Mannosylphosphorylation of N-linked oligosaccharides effector, putative n=1 Tax=Candida dubliniensis (strain CD36 / ATCC MYA-646 / CBS 7987 / NCPF 3949 / NRRL Y-17841) TaxID=573826 RepID=B9W750_CANDC|nr:mannosylphosphorylation of N-linked oligosaccharides effector, putative [Candida dubliniensis CD36]CAX44509.1 mannosylphosphorylation of N-linked oligosaccharides effector, putative [Candida dubliniensis CD36]